VYMRAPLSPSLPGMSIPPAHPDRTTCASGSMFPVPFVRPQTLVATTTVVATTSASPLAVAPTDAQLMVTSLPLLVDPVGVPVVANFTPATVGSNSTRFYCHLCAIECMGPAAFDQHLNGKPHAKVVRKGHKENIPDTICRLSFPYREDFLGGPPSSASCAGRSYLLPSTSIWLASVILPTWLGLLPAMLMDCPGCVNVMVEVYLCLLLCVVNWHLLIN
jgi:hypothetical protein